jgi:hypothetical protein
LSRSNWPSSRPAVQPSNRPDEATYASRIEREKITARINQNLAKKLRIYCATARIDMQDIIERGIELFFAEIESEQASGRPAVQPSTVLRTQDVVCDLNTDLKNTHNKTNTGPSSRPAGQSGQPMLPATGGGELIQMAGSKFELATIEKYAFASYRHSKRHHQEGIRNPQGWAIAAKRSGRCDELIQEWIDSPGMFEG